ncbi:hypothetical protein O6H91_07G002300 [Diphasiastrum complanatum]|nr:hypothetical protein O6H91_07G002300 [Diphasiastrum complanatum]
MSVSKIASNIGPNISRDSDISGVSESIHLLCKKGLQKEAMYLLACLEALDEKASCNSYASALKACSKLKTLACGSFVHSLIIDQGLKQDLQLGFHLVEFYIKCGCVRDAQEVFDELRDRDVRTWSSMILAYAKSGRPEKALEVFSQMQRQGITPNEFTYVGVLKACSTLPSLEQGKEVHAQIIKQGLGSHAIVGNTLVDMYSKCGCLIHAREVFDQMSSRNVVSWNAMIGGYAKGGQGEKGLELFEKMQCEGLKPNEVTYVGVLNACASLSDLKKGKEVHSQILLDGFVSNIFVASTLIDMYAKCGSINDARKVFDKMPVRTVVPWTSMIMAYVRDGWSREALELYQQMQKEGTKANEYTYVGLLNSCANLSTLKEGKHIHDEICKRGFGSNVFLGSALVDMYAKCGSIADARTVFDKMPRKDLVAWNAMIAGYAKDGHVNEAFELFEQIPEACLQPNEVTFTGLLSACATLYSLEQVKRVHAQILECGFESSVFLASALVDIYAEHGCIQEARKFFDNIPAKDLILWNSMISGCLKKDLGKEALELFQQMQTEGIEPNEVTFVGLLNACASLLSLKQGSWVHSLVLESQFESNVFVASALVDMYSKCGSLQDARKVFDRIPSRDIIIWSAMVAGYALHGHGLEALQLFGQMQHEGAEFANLNLTCLFSACSHAGLINQGLHYFDSLNRIQTFIFTVEHYGCMIDLLSRAGQLKDAVDMITSMPVQPTVTLWMALLGACQTYHDVEVAEKVLKHVLC